MKQAYSSKFLLCVAALAIILFTLFALGGAESRPHLAGRVSRYKKIVGEI